MPTTKLTDAAIERLAPPATGCVEYYYFVVPGLHLRVTTNGVRTFALMTRLRGRQMRLTLGRFGVLFVSEARERARTALAQVEAGIDPRDERRRQEAERPVTLADAAERFIDTHARRNTRPRTATETERILRLHVLPYLGVRTLASITRAEILVRLDAMVADEKPVAANRCLAMLRSLFGWYVERELVAVSPVAGVRPPTVEQSRDRVLSDEEVSALWRAWERIGYPYGPMCQLMLLTAQRRSEIAAMRWRDIDLENGLWTLPANSNKSGRMHEVPLSLQALAILCSLPRLGRHVFVGRSAADRPVSGFSQAKRRVDELVAIEDWCFHDLRRSAATGMARLGTPHFVIAQVLNHAVGGPTRIYNRASYLDEKRKALEAWGRKVDALIPEPVVPEPLPTPAPEPAPVRAPEDEPLLAIHAAAMSQRPRTIDEPRALLRPASAGHAAPLGQRSTPQLVSDRLGQFVLQLGGTGIVRPKPGNPG